MPALAEIAVTGASGVESSMVEASLTPCAEIPPESVNHLNELEILSTEFLRTMAGAISIPEVRRRDRV
jgi:hypothetical protein